MIAFFSDPHIGLNRQSGTTPATRVAIQNNILDIVHAIPEGRVCLGDLVDKYTNNEEIIMDALGVLIGTSLCLAGNHDLKNTSDSVGTLQLLREVKLGKIVSNDFGETGAYEYTLNDGTDIVAVPHCSTQDIFFASLVEAEEMGGDILLLHCNYNAPEHHGLSDTELNLRKEDAEELLKVFKYILIGHEHNAAEHFGGRLKIIGAPYPTSFNDMKCKRYLQYENGEFTSVETWNSSKYAEFTWPDVPANLDRIEFVKIVGTRTQAEGKEFLAAMNHLRKNNGVLAIKDATVLDSVKAEYTEAGHPMKLSESISKTLAERPDELALWEQLSLEQSDD